MKKLSEENSKYEDLRSKIIGLGEKSLRKSYYPELQQRIKELENTNKSLQEEITERQRVERELNDSREQYKRLVERSPGIIYSLSLKRGGIYYSSHVETILGYSLERLYKEKFLWRKSINKEHLKRVDRAVQDFLNGKEINIEYLIKDAKGEWHWFLDRSIGVRNENDDTIIECMAIDITEQKQITEAKITLEKQLRQAQKMEALGNLAGGIAHDFNNILTPILGYVDIAQSELPEESPIQIYLNEIYKASDRAKELVKQILTFSRKTEISLKPVKFSMIVKEAVKFLRASIPSSIEINMNIKDDCAVVLAEPTQLHQIVMNLGTNSYHAMRGQNGILEIEVTKIDLEDESFCRKSNIKKGQYVKLSISDTGHGMTKEETERIFEPYYTTKEKNEGTGLGLSIVHSIVKNCGGDIFVYSELGKGTIFNIYLPVAILNEVENEAKEIEPIKGGTEKILIVDDEEQILDISKKMLEKLGYIISQFKSPLEALEAFSADPKGNFDLVITDLSMPKMNGVQFIENILKLNPDIPVILCSGFNENMSEEKMHSIGIHEYIMKPMTKKDLAKVVRKVLDNK